MKTLSSTALGSRSADFNRTVYHLEVDPSVTIDDLLRPNFWAHHAGNLKRFDLIDVLPSDGSFDITLRVTETGIGFVKMRPIRIWSEEHQVKAPAATEEDLPEVPAGYKVNHAPKTGWRVLTEEPVMEISRNHRSKREAIMASISHAEKAGALAA